MDRSASLPAAPAHEMREPLLGLSSAALRLGPAAPVRERVRVHVRASDYRRQRRREMGRGRGRGRDRKITRERAREKDRGRQEASSARRKIVDASFMPPYVPSCFVY
jgi:hypothetical protein